MERGKEPKLLEIQRRWKLKSAAVADNMEDTVTGASLSAVKVKFLSNQVKQMIVEQIRGEREFPFHMIPGNTILKFTFPSHGILQFPFPFPGKGSFGRD